MPLRAALEVSSVKLTASPRLIDDLSLLAVMLKPVIWGTLLSSPSSALAGRTMRLMTMVMANSKERNFFM